MQPFAALRMRPQTSATFGGMASLFAATEKGAYYDFTDGTKLFKNSDGTGGNSDVGGPCKWAIDLSPNNNHLRNTVTSVTRRATGIETSGTNYGLFNVAGSGNWPNIVEPFEIICTLEQIAYAGTDKVILVSNGGGVQLIQGATSGVSRIYDAGYWPDMATSLATEFTIDAIFATAGRSQSLNNGTPVNGSTGGQAFDGVFLGSGSGGGASGTQTRFKRMLVIGRVLTAVERAGAYAWASA